MELELINFLDIPLKKQLETREWRNSSEVIPYFKIKYINEDVHEKWIGSLQNKEPTNIAFLIRYHDKYVGVTYFHSIDYRKKQADWGMYIHLPQYRGKGIGFETLNRSILYAKEVLHMDSLYLDVMEKNVAAVHLYKKCGFCFVENEQNGFLRYKLDLRATR